MAWRDIADSEVDPESPVTTSLAQAWRDNPIGIANGDAGAPRVASDQAVDWSGNGTGVSPASDWVLARTSDANVGAVGTYAFLREETGSDITAGENVSGSNLIYYGVSDTDESTGDSPSGTWKCMGRAFSATGTVFLRIS